MDGFPPFVGVRGHSRFRYACHTIDGRIPFEICLACCFDQRRQMIKEIPVNIDIKLNLLIKSLMENFEKISSDFSSYCQNPLISMCLLCTMFRMNWSQQ